MSLQLSNILSTLLFLICLHTESTTAPSFSLIQMPSFLNVVEGTTLRMECKIEIPNNYIWSIRWYVNKTYGQTTLSNTSSISIITNVGKGWSNLTLNRANMTDSGIYVCEVQYINGSHISRLPNNGTQVTINELTDLMVNQTPDRIDEKEGANVTIECRFRTVSNYSTMYVRWWKDGQMTSETDSLTVIQETEKGFTSLTLKDMKEGDSGFYVCEVGSRSRNLSESGTPSHVVITGREKKPSKLNDVAGAGAVVGAGVGAGVGVLLLALVLIGVFVWRRKQSSKGTPLATSEPESASTKEVTTKHPPLASQASEVTYAHLQFNKREVKPDAEVVYAEVKVGRKQKRSLD